MSTTYRMNDESIAMIAKLLQVALLTGTDVVDNIRTMRFEVSDDDSLVPTAEYVENFNNNLEKMLNSIDHGSEQ